VIERWLALLCQLLPGVVQAVVVRRDGSLWTRWPKDRDAEPLRAFCAADAKVEDARYQATPAGLTRLAMPLSNGKLRIGTVAVELPLRPDQRPTTELLLRWSQAWLELLSETGRETQRGPERILQVLEQGSRFDNLPDNASSLATALVDQFGFNRVLICLRQRGRLRVTGVSHAPTFDRRSDMFALLEADLERLGNNETLPEQSEYARWLATRKPALQVLPLRLGEQGFCVILHVPEQVPSNATKAQCRQIARLIAPLYESQNRLREGMIWRWRAALQAHFQQASLRRKWLWGAGIAALLLLFLCLPGQHRVTAHASLEGKIQRAIVAPEEGYLQEASVKAGEIIRQGQVLAQLDDKSIQLEIQRWLGEKQEYERQYNRELTALNPVEMRIAKAKIAQADAQLNLYRERLQRVRITAPIDGVIIKGDLSRAIGSPVQRGQVLYEIAPLDAFKLIIQVPQNSIRHVAQGQGGEVLLSSLPHRALPFSVISVASVYSEQEQDIVYRVEAQIDNPELANLRPGMSGYAKIAVGRKPYAWLITHPLLDWLALKFWRL
jgi:Membrane-fusion protein